MTKIKKSSIKYIVALVIPLVLILLFLLVRTNRAMVDFWVFHILAPVIQLIGSALGIIPFAVGELCVIIAVFVAVFWLCRCLFLGIREKQMERIWQGIFPIILTGLWTMALVHWMWNITYYATGFTVRSGLDVSPYSVEELYDITDYFAQKAGEYSTYPQRTAEGIFDESREDIFRQGIHAYDNLGAEFTILAKKDVGAKPLLLSKFQSILGFTGIYFPLTGEANVNVASPSAFLPATIAHEMAHQRLIASEQEANFVGITASITSEDPVYQYSGYLLGLVQLSNALYPVDPEGWNEIVQTHFTPELSTDWAENQDYWRALESPVEQLAEATYDGFLKGNGQELGIQSYGACVDLLVAYFSPKI